MVVERFNRFAQLIDGIHKNIQSIKTAIAPSLGVKSVHVFWIYELLSCPGGLTAAELAARSRINRSLVSREIAELAQKGYIEVKRGGGEKRGNYNSRIVLTDKGIALAKAIRARAMRIQTEAGAGISEEELYIFYSTLEKLNNNLRKIADRT